MTSVAVPNAQGIEAPQRRTMSPIVTGTSVIALRYKDGIMMIADTLASYGSMARFPDVERIKTVGDGVLIGASGEYSDFQHVMEILEDWLIDDQCIDDGRVMTAAEVHSFLTRVMYNRRLKINPLWNSYIIAGVHNGKRTLGTVDHIGTAFEDNYLATGIGHHYAMPLLRERWQENMSEEEARALLESVARICYYRDCRTINKFQLAKVTAEGALVSKPYQLQTKWDYKAFVDPKGGGTTAGGW